MDKDFKGMKIKKNFAFHVDRMLSEIVILISISLLQCCLFKKKNPP